MAATEDKLGALHDALATILTQKVQEEDTPAAILAVAAKFLKDNNITCSPAGDNALGELEAALREKRNRARITAQDRAELGLVADVSHLMQ